jgi:GNAT superfamily N-acetyltransferase
MIIDVMEKCGRIWIYEVEGQPLGFSAADKRTSSIWALFVLPAWEKRGVGKQLLREAVQWLWSRELFDMTYFSYRLNNRAAFVPPKPKLFESA